VQFPFHCAEYATKAKSVLYGNRLRRLRNYFCLITVTDPYQNWRTELDTAVDVSLQICLSVSDARRLSAAVIRGVNIRNFPVAVRSVSLSKRFSTQKRLKMRRGVGILVPSHFKQMEPTTMLLGHHSEESDFGYRKTAENMASYHRK
jgi:hypothetical protein